MAPLILLTLVVIGRFRELYLCHCTKLHARNERLSSLEPTYLLELRKLDSNKNLLAWFRIEPRYPLTPLKFQTPHEPSRHDDIRA
jgi:hypothetical protein